MFGPKINLLSQKKFGPKKVRQKNNGQKKCWSQIIFSQINVRSKKLLGQKILFQVNATPRPVVLTIEHILNGNNSHQGKLCVCKCLCASRPKILFL